MSFYKEPTIKCPKCSGNCHAEWIDIGFGPYSQQVGPFNCRTCDWIEEDSCQSEKCIGNKCTAYDYCKGRAKILKE